MESIPLTPLGDDTTPFLYLIPLQISSITHRLVSIKSNDSASVCTVFDRKIRLLAL